MASKYTESARGQNCTVRLPGTCNHRPETTVLAHLNGGGMAIKHSDIHGCYACSDCHTWLDRGYTQQGVTRKDRDLIHLKAILETQQIMIKTGVLVL